MKKRYKPKGIFCLEGDWWGVKDKTTVEPVLELHGHPAWVERLATHGP